MIREHKALNIRLLRESIEAWEKKRDEKDVFEIKMGPDTCPLCQQYASRLMPDRYLCEACPVFVAVGSKFCDNTPYYPALEFHESWMALEERENEPGFMDIPLARAAWWEAANREVLFLKKLLAEWEK